jgi:hypothetical protein
MIDIHLYSSTQTINKTNQHIKTKTEKWLSKALHGRFASASFEETIDKHSSFLWLSSGGLFPETEGFIFAIQDQVIPTRNFQRYIENQEIDDKCRLCHSISEAIQHISAGCKVLSGTEYTERHNAIAKIIQQEVAIDTTEIYSQKNTILSIST